MKVKAARLRREEGKQFPSAAPPVSDLPTKDTRPSIVVRTRKMLNYA